MLFITFSTIDQTNPETAKIATKIEMLFPEGKSKALILNYNYGAKQDRKLASREPTLKTGNATLIVSFPEIIEFNLVNKLYLLFFDKKSPNKH